MSEVPETVIEEDNKNDNEEVPEKNEEPKAEEIKVETPEETTKAEAPKEDEQFKNKTDRMKNKRVKCEGCQAEMTLKTLRYSHKCNGKTEDKPIKPKPKTKAVAVKPIENQVIKAIPPTKVKEQVTQHSEPIEVKTKQQPIIRMKPPPEPVRQPTATELLHQSYNEIKRLRQQEKQEKIQRFRSSMF